MKKEKWFKDFKYVLASISTFLAEIICKYVNAVGWKGVTSLFESQFFLPFEEAA